jgi:hypothetical protein
MAVFSKRIIGFSLSMYMNILVEILSEGVIMKDYKIISSKSSS